MLDYLDFDCVPYDEKCSQIGHTSDFLKMNAIEYEVIKHQLVRMFGNPPNRAYFKRKVNYHDFGTYYSLAIYYHDYDEDEVQYVFKIEEEFPAKWDDISKRELQEAGYKI